MYLVSFVAMVTLQSGQGQLQPGIAKISLANIRFVSVKRDSDIKASVQSFSLEQF